MPELDEVSRKYPSHASSADDSNPHVRYPFSNLIASCAPVSGALVIGLSRAGSRWYQIRMASIVLDCCLFERSLIGRNGRQEFVVQQKRLAPTERAL